MFHPPATTTHKALFTGALLAALVIALLPTSGSPPLFEHQDKVQHALVFAALTSWALALWPTRLRRIVLGMLGYGVLMEIAQSMTTYRYGDVWDFCADACGIALAWGIQRWRAQATR